MEMKHLIFSLQAMFFFWISIRSIKLAHIVGCRQPSRRERPMQFWLVVGFFAILGCLFFYSHALPLLGLR